LAGLGIAGGVFGTIRFEANTRRPQLEALAAQLARMAEKAVKGLPLRRKELGSGEVDSS
jgi:hypothetical protein